MGNKITQIYPEEETKPIFRDQNEWSWPKVTRDQTMMIFRDQNELSWPKVTRDQIRDQTMMIVKDFFSRNNFSEEEIKEYIKHPELIGGPK